MAADPLGPPPSILSTEHFEPTRLSPTRLVRISAYHTGEPYFGRSGHNRFDAPGALAGKPEFGVCYFGTSLQLAITESILHDEMPVDGRFLLTRSQVDTRYPLYFGGSELRLLNLTGARLKRLGGSVELSGTTNYGLTQQWARAVHDNPAGYDGFLYMSRHLNTGRAVALFDRAHDAIHLDFYSPLASANGFRMAVRQLAIDFT